MVCLINNGGHCCNAEYCKASEGTFATGTVAVYGTGFGVIVCEAIGDGPGVCFTTVDGCGAGIDGIG